MHPSAPIHARMPRNRWFVRLPALHCSVKGGRKGVLTAAANVGQPTHWLTGDRLTVRRTRMRDACARIAPLFRSWYDEAEHLLHTLQLTGQSHGPWRWLIAGCWLAISARCSLSARCLTDCRTAPCRRSQRLPLPERRAAAQRPMRRRASCGRVRLVVGGGGR